MVKEKHPKLTVITNDDLQKEKIKDSGPYHPDVSHSDSGGNRAEYSTNPIYEKLVKFKMEQKRKRFTVEDLLKW